MRAHTAFQFDVLTEKAPYPACHANFAKRLDCGGAPLQSLRVLRGSLEEIANDVVGETLAELPPEVAEAAGGVTIFVEIRPDSDDLEIGVGRDWLGIFEGAAYDDRHGIHPPRIRIWTRNIWLHSSGRVSTFREEVRKTLLHEIGHYLGLDEIEIQRRGLE